jgi:light-regulated signal transduction histidine kinase (bacteriophytochrome)
MEPKPSYEELIAKLAELEEIISALRNQEVDAVVGAKNILMLRLKETEDELRKQRDYLDGLVKELDAANKELEGFSYSVSHDLRAPLRAIDGYSRKLAVEYGDKLDSEAGRIIGVIRSNTKRMGVLIDDLLSFSRVQKAGLNISEIEMAKVITEVWDEMQAANKDRQLELKITKILPANGDPSLIRQVLVNLLSNAVKYTKNKIPGIIEISSYSNSGNIVYCLKDNGIGFNMKYYDKLFGVFQRLHSSEEYDGTGIGLAIVQRIVKRHGGNVWAEGEVDKGATFYFTLPTKGISPVSE